jgi:predicted membrane channel-forming protein YqfA (hemolysin III family)
MERYLERMAKFLATNIYVQSVVVVIGLVGAAIFAIGWVQSPWLIASGVLLCAVVAVYVVSLMIRSNRKRFSVPNTWEATTAHLNSLFSGRAKIVGLDTHDPVLA